VKPNIAMLNSLKFDINDIEDRACVGYGIRKCEDY